MSKLLTNKKQAWVNQFKPTAVLRGKPLNYNAALSERYKSKLERLIREMTKTTNKKLEALFKSNTAKTYFAQDASLASQARILVNSLTAQFEELFAKQAKPLAKSMVKQADKTSKSALAGSLKELSGGLTLKTNFLNSDLKEVLTASVAENVSLIKSIPAQYMQQVQGSVMRSITTGNGMADLVPALMKYEGITIRRARNIALDQTKKVYSGLNAGRMESMGIDKYEWLHSGGSAHPREEHVAMSGKIYSLSDPPVIDSKTGERGKPGDLPNCSCRMLPVIEVNKGSSV